MGQFKAVATVTWKFDTEGSKKESLEHAKKQLEKILNCNPHGNEYDCFHVQVNINSSKKKQNVIHLKTYSVDEILSHITVEETKKEFLVGETSYLVRMNSERYHVFAQNRYCVSCGLEGKHMILDTGDCHAHFNLYGEEHGRLVLMTKDHIVPKSKGGSDQLSNFRTMCSACNSLNANDCLELSQIQELRRLASNPDKLSKIDLREIMRQVRENFKLLQIA